MAIRKVERGFGGWGRDQKTHSCLKRRGLEEISGSNLIESLLKNAHLNPMGSRGSKEEDARATGLEIEAQK